jgi:hypothetical protein
MVKKLLFGIGLVLCLLVSPAAAFGTDDGNAPPPAGVRGDKDKDPIVVPAPPKPKGKNLCGSEC